MFFKNQSCANVLEEDQNKFVGLYICDTDLSKINLSEKKFYGCTFKRCTFNKNKIHNLFCRMCLFEFSNFNETTFEECDIKFSSFSGSILNNVLFANSNIIQTNFNGIYASKTTYDDVDLYASRFIRSSFSNVIFSNCNIKKSVFWECQNHEMNFKASNTREAIFDKNGSSLSKGK